MEEFVMIYFLKAAMYLIAAVALSLLIIIVGIAYIYLVAWLFT